MKASPIQSTSPSNCRTRRAGFWVCLLLLVGYVGLGTRFLWPSLHLPPLSTDAKHVYMDHFLSSGLGVAQPTGQLVTLLESVPEEGLIVFFGRNDIRSEMVKNLVTSLAQPRKVVPFGLDGDNPPELPVRLAPSALIFLDAPNPGIPGRQAKLGRLTFVQLGELK